MQNRSQYIAYSDALKRASSRCCCVKPPTCNPVDVDANGFLTGAKLEIIVDDTLGVGDLNGLTMTKLKAWDWDATKIDIVKRFGPCGTMTFGDEDAQQRTWRTLVRKVPELTAVLNPSQDWRRQHYQKNCYAIYRIYSFY